MYDEIENACINGLWKKRKGAPLQVPLEMNNKYAIVILN